MKFSQQVLQWFDQHGRKDLPWQQEITPYRVWISEIMLQQTQVKTVIPYYQRFMQSFPDIKSLAETPLDDVLHHWSGLGYYNRAKNLHKTAQIIQQQFQGEFPHTVESLSQLPGIGRSTAGAIAAIAMQQHAAILDGNVKRVLARCFAIEGWPGRAATLKQLWQVAEEHTPQKRTADYTQAMMDLGAMVCTRSKPDCPNCPLQARCLAFKQQRIAELPGKKPKKSLPIKQTRWLVLQHQDEILLYKRPPTGIWPSLYGLPEFVDEQDLRAFMLKQSALTTQATTMLDEFRHTFSHYHLDIHASHIALEQKPLSVMEDEQILWYNMRQPQDVGLAAPLKRIINKLIIG